MSKTINFLSPAKLSTFRLALCLLVLWAHGAFAQPSPRSVPTRATPSSSPAARLKQAPKATTADPKSLPWVSQTEINSSIPDDAAVEKMLEPYVARVRALEVVIGRLEGDLQKGGMGGGSLGNFVTDGLRVEASMNLGQPVDLVVTNSGGLRKNAIAPGELRVRDIFELLPFENKLVALEVTGEQLLNVLSAVVSSREPQSGARILYRTGADQQLELVGAKLIGANGTETDIRPAATYRIITIDYLLSVSGGSLAILKQAKSTKPLGITIRDAMVEFVKAETAAGRTVKATLDGRFTSLDPGPVKQEERPA
jgi:2',3'-cyclic-nucleotide 2'-phosphodiesterase (5'-nucleotidase family)